MKNKYISVIQIVLQNVVYMSVALSVMLFITIFLSVCNVDPQKDGGGGIYVYSDNQTNVIQGHVVRGSLIMDPTAEKNIVTSKNQNSFFKNYNKYVKIESSSSGFEVLRTQDFDDSFGVHLTHEHITGAEKFTVNRSCFLLTSRSCLQFKDVFEYSKSGYFPSGSNKQPLYASDIYMLNELRSYDYGFHDKAEGRSYSRMFGINSDLLVSLGEGVFNRVQISVDFEGKIYIFSDISGEFYRANNNYRVGNAELIYGTAIADKLAEAGVTHIDLNKTLTVKANDFVILNPSSDPVSVRALMKAAEEVNDYRLLIIERTGVGSDNKVNITAFGQTTQVDAGTTYEWKFNEAQASEIRKYVVDELSMEY